MDKNGIVTIDQGLQLSINPRIERIVPSAHVINVNSIEYKL